MPVYFGTEAQQHLQALAESGADVARNTPGACQAGRTMGCDDPERLGWTLIEEMLARDGVFSFRLLSAAQAEEVRRHIATRDLRFDTWDVFLGERAGTLAACQAIVSRGLPGGLSDLVSPAAPEDTAPIQALMGSAGIVPFSGSFLVGAYGPATTVAVGDQSGAIVAAAHGYLPHNAHSAYRRYAWGGLVAVADSQRGKGLGTYVNARMIVDVFRKLDATHVYELVSASNVPSRRMVESCGLRHAPHLVCGVVTRTASARFTK